MTENDGDLVITIQDSDILEVLEDADALLARLVADGELLTGGARRPPARATRPRRKGKRR